MASGPPPLSPELIELFKKEHQHFVDLAAKPETRKKVRARAKPKFVHPKYSERVNWWERLPDETLEQSSQRWTDGFLRTQNLSDCLSTNEAASGDHTGIRSTPKLCPRPNVDSTSTEPSILSCFLPVITTEIAQQHDDWSGVIDAYESINDACHVDALPDLVCEDEDMDLS